ncbi:NAD(P)-dependent oxidoreductase [Streptomyces sp. NPDC007901]|uniref:NAD(P)-dependent oxidoreductase n=1 Tax=Streptomyces sp. NPDC007901 TaxID=3364785 RepID=UPI0036EB4CF2
MGTPLCGRLVSAGHTVTAFDVRPEREEPARSLGADRAPSAATAAAGADVLATPGAVWIDMTSNAPAVAEVLRARAAAHGVDVLEAPLGGSPDDAEHGHLRLFVGGSPEVLDRCRPLLEAVTASDRISHMGGPGTGYTTKLLINLLWFGQATATAEALPLGRRAGIDLAAPRHAGRQRGRERLHPQGPVGPVRRGLPAFLRTRPHPRPARGHHG